MKREDPAPARIHRRSLRASAQKQWPCPHPTEPDFIIERKLNSLLPFCYPTR
jgi:hypothetical protein